MPGTPDIGTLFFKTAGMLMLVIAVLVAALWLMRRLSAVRGLGGGAGRVIQVEAMHHFSPREKVALVNVRGRRLLLGVTQQSISCLASFDGPEDGAREAAEPVRDFREIISKNLAPALRDREIREDSGSAGHEE